MKLQEIFDQLSYGELSQLSIGGNDQGVIDAGNYARVLGHISLGLTALYKRFALKESRLSFPLQKTVDTYSLDVVDLIKIEKVLTDDAFELSLNQNSDAYGCFTPALSVLRIPQIVLDQSAGLPDELKTTNLTVVYRANHPKLEVGVGVFDPTTKEVELPGSHLMALLYFVASRAHNPIGMVNEFNAGNTWFAKYEAECQRLTTENLQVDQGDTNYRLVRNGWV